MRRAVFTFLSAALLSFIAVSILSAWIARYKPQATQHFNSPHKVFAVSLVVLLAVFAVALLCCYPGFCSVDSRDIINQALGESHYSLWHRYEGLSAHHPVFYTFLVWVVFSLTSFANDIYVSIAVFNACQMVFVALAVAASLAMLDKNGAPAWVIVLGLAFYALAPVLSAHAITMWKDVPFSACMLLLVALLACIARKGDIGKQDVVVLTVLLVVSSLFRTNGAIVAVFTLVALMIGFRQRIKPLLASLAGVLAVVLLLPGLVYPALSISSAHFSESVSIPLQQLAATISDGGNTAEADRQFLDKVLPLEEWEDGYNPQRTNSIKFNESFDDEFLEANKAEFVMVWLRTMPANLKSYAKAWVNITCGYWQPGYESAIGKGYTLDKGKVTDLSHLGFNPQKIANAMKPYFPLLFGMGSYIWLVLLTMVLCLARGGMRALGHAAVALMPLLVLVLTLLLAAPVAGDYRYVLALYLCIPLLPYIVQCIAVETPSGMRGETNQ